MAVVAFNKFDLIVWQRRLLRAHLQDKFDLLIIDNSSDAQVAEKIGFFCGREKIHYVRVPVEAAPLRDGSYSHGLALNWACRHVLPAYERVIFLDHDVFPVRPTSILKGWGSSPFYGLHDSRGPRWYLWPGFAAFDLKRIKPKSLDFRPVLGLDTGGGNWKALFSRVDLGRLPPLLHSRYARFDDLLAAPLEAWNACVFDHDDPREMERRSAQDEIGVCIGDWFHFCNGSNWRGGDDGCKREKMERLLEKMACGEAITRGAHLDPAAPVGQAPQCA